MPLPEPKKNEKEREFIARCIEALTREKRDEFPARAQRAAVCYSQWDRQGKKKS